MSGILKQVFTQSWLIALSNKHFLTLSVGVDLGALGGLQWLFWKDFLVVTVARVK